jgi:RimJ/RimL family protein N-acetyltransferase
VTDRRTRSPLALRPLVDEDRWRVYTWRNSERIRSVSVDDRPIPRHRHNEWFDSTIGDRVDQLRVVEWEGRPIALVQIEALDVSQAIASWGCYLGETDGPRGLGGALPLIALNYGFTRLGLRRMTSRVLGSNARMLAIHTRYEIPVEGVLRRHLVRADGHEADVHLFGVHRDEWPHVREAALRPLRPRIRSAVTAVTW